MAVGRCIRVAALWQLASGVQLHHALDSDRSIILKSKQAPDLVDWRLCDATVHSNLGGMGPDSGEAEIRYINVATANGEDIDIVVTNTSEYFAAKVDRNGRKDCFGMINLLSPSTVTLSFRFVRSGTNDPVEVSQSFFTVYDIDESNNGMKEQVTLHAGWVDYVLPSNSELVESYNNDWSHTFTSTVWGNGLDNPSDPRTLTPAQEVRTVMAEYHMTTEYTITFGALGEAKKAGEGRNFLFAGKSALKGEEHKCEGGDCEVWADPHVSGFDNAAKGPVAFLGGYMSTFDRQPVDVNAYETGDFWLVKNADVEIQGRYKLSKEFGGNRAAVGALAVGGSFIGGSKLVIEPKSGTVEWNGKQLGENSKFDLSDTSFPVALTTYYGASHEHGSAPSGVDVSLPLGISLKVRRYNTHLDLKITAKKRLSDVDGQCGNFNGDAQDDSLEHIKGRMHGLTVAPEESLFSS